MRRNSSKRKERGESEDPHDAGEKRSRVSYEVKEEKKVRSHEVPGKSSTDGTASSSASKSGSYLLSLDVLAKAKRALQMHKELAAKKLKKKLPLPPSSEGDTSQMLLRQHPKAHVLRLDALGREIDQNGNVVVNTSTNFSTLKVNINSNQKKKEEALFQILKPELGHVHTETNNPHFDARMGIDANKLLRPRRPTIQFLEPGNWSRDAGIIKLESQFGEAQPPDINNPNPIEVSERVPKDPIPEVEWWDLDLLRFGNYGDINDGGKLEDLVKMEKITIYLRHPRPIEPPAEPAPPPPQPLKLTKKEQKKMRTQKRLAKEKDRQEMIRQGILKPPKAKVKMSNLMKVLGSEATQDPTRMEMEIRSAAAEREQAHIDRNIARKLTPDERKKKNERKLFGDPNTVKETIVSVFKVNNDLSHAQTRFRVDANAAKQNRLTGCAVMIYEGVCVVVVEGGNKSIKRYENLMLKKNKKSFNKCVLLWQGAVAKNSFHRFSVHECRTEAAAKKVFSDAGVSHYWDLAAN